MIKKSDSGYVLKTKDGKKTLGKHKTRKEAAAQERAIYARKAQAAMRPGVIGIR